MSDSCATCLLLPCNFEGDNNPFFMIGKEGGGGWEGRGV